MQVVNKFNRGEIDDLLLAREEVPKIQDSASLVENMELVRFGAMRFRNGTESLGECDENSYFISFVYNINETASLQFTATSFTPWIDDTPLSNDTLATVGAITDESDTNGVVVLGASIDIRNGDREDGVGRIKVDGTANDYINIVVDHASVKMIYGDENTILGVGSHNIKILEPFILIESIHDYIASVTISAVPVGIVTFPIEISDLSSLRYSVSSSVIYFAHLGELFQIERRGKTSWSLVKTRVDDGVFGKINKTLSKLSVGAISGDTQLTSSSDLFTPLSVSTLFKLGSIGQVVSQETVSNDVATDSIRITGVGANRAINYKVIIGQVGTSNVTNNTSTSVAVTSDTGEVTTTTSGQSIFDDLAVFGDVTDPSTAIVKLQRSPDEATWENVEGFNESKQGSRQDDLNNSITFYRLYVSPDQNASGLNIIMELSTNAGSIEGICRVKSVVSPTVAEVQILKPMGGTGETSDWYQSVWKKGSNPSVINLFSSRLYYGGSGNIWGSLPDNFTSFDSDIEGDSRSIRKRTGFESGNSPNWLASTNKLLLGLATGEISMRSDAFGTAITQSNLNIVASGSLGSANIDTGKIDNDILFVHRSLKKLILAVSTYQSDSYDNDDLMSFNQQICDAGIKRIAVVREPDTRVYCALNNGEMRVLLYDKTENIRGWYRFVTDGHIRDVIATPGNNEDIVRILVTRGSKTYFEKLSSSTSGNYTDSSGGGNKTYKGRYKSGKIGYVNKHSILNERARIYSIGFIGKGKIRAIKYGNSFNKLKSFGEKYKGKIESLDTDYLDHDHVKLDFNGKIETDSRVCLEVTKPCTIMAMTYDLKESNNPLKDRK